MKRDNIFLTGTRRDVLAGESDLEGKSLANEKSRIRTRSRAAIEELTEVAQSPMIENADVFEPEEIGDLLFFVLRDPGHVDTLEGGLVDTPEEVEQYRNAVLAQLFKQIAKYGEFDVGRFDD